VTDTFSTGNVLTLVIVFAGLGATWGGVLWRVGRIEKDLEGILRTVDTKLTEFQGARERQGERIGEMEWEVARLCERAGMAAPSRRRRTTKAAGEPIG
jgi:hypothetical protein